MRTVWKWNSDWGFRKGETKDGNEAWECVTLPHTWNAADGQDGGSDYYQGAAWYQKTLTKEERWKQVYLRFGAVSKTAEVWCNGTLCGSHRGGFAAFTVDLTPYLADGENEILVKADNSADLPVYPEQADFTFFGGIYRDVELICFDTEAHFDVAGCGTDAIFVDTAVREPDRRAVKLPEDGCVKIRVCVTGGARVRAKIYDADENCVAETGDAAVCGVPADAGDSTVRGSVTGRTGGRAAGGSVTGQPGAVTVLCLEAVVPDARRWKGAEDPYLYRVCAELFEGDAAVDCIEASFGFREFSVDAEKGFFLNGASYPLRGVCRHQDREHMGWALTEREHLSDMAVIREIGANTIRLAHYQQSPYFYDLCDRNGLIVWAEIPFISVYDPREEADENLRQQLRELILQNYNHPSVCFWGLANELGIGGESEAMYAILRELQQTAKELDAGRLTTIANVGMTKTDSPLFHISDLTSYNEYMGWYEGTADDHGTFCDERHAQIPDIPLAVSEYGADSVLSWHSEEPKVKDYTEEYQAIVHEKAYAAFEKRPYLWATWLWNLFDFAADGRDEGGCQGRNNKGLVTFDRQTRKQAFYFYKACWSSEPFVYICGKRFTKRAKDEITVKVYSNQPAVKLWVNGVYAGETSGRCVFTFEQVALSERFTELYVKTPDGCSDTLIIERVDAAPEEYIYKEEKKISGEVAQWFANLVPAGDTIVKEIVIREGYLSVDDSMDVLCRYKEAQEALQELIVTPLAAANPAMAGRFSAGGALTFTSIWHHIGKMLPDEAYYLLNERLNKIPK